MTEEQDYQRWLDQKARARAIEFELASTRPGAAKSAKCAVTACPFPALVRGLCHTCNLRGDDDHARHFENRSGGSSSEGTARSGAVPRGYQEAREKKPRMPRKVQPDKLLEFALELGPQDRRSLDLGPLDTIALEEWQNPEVGSAC